MIFDNGDHYKFKAIDVKYIPKMIKLITQSKSQLFEFFIVNHLTQMACESIYSGCFTLVIILNTFTKVLNFSGWIL